DLADEHRGATLEDLLFATKSVGAVFGLELMAKGRDQGREDWPGDHVEHGVCALRRGRRRTAIERHDVCSRGTGQQERKRADTSGATCDDERAPCQATQPLKALIGSDAGQPHRRERDGIRVFWQGGAMRTHRSYPSAERSE